MYSVAENATKQVKYIKDAHSFTAIASGFRRWVNYYLRIVSTAQVIKNTSQFGVPVGFLSQLVKKEGHMASHFPYDSTSRFCYTTGIPLALFSCPVDRKGRLISKNGIKYFVLFCKDYNLMSILSRNDIMSDIVAKDFYKELDEVYEELGIPFKFKPVELNLSDEDYELVQVFSTSPKNWLDFYNKVIMGGAIKDKAFDTYVVGSTNKYDASMQRVRSFCKVYNIPQRLFVWDTEDGRLPSKVANVDLKEFLKQATGKVHTRLVHENYNNLFSN